jgi:hypothetical protein
MYLERTLSLSISLVNFVFLSVHRLIFTLPCHLGWIFILAFHFLAKLSANSRTCHLALDKDMETLEFIIYPDGRVQEKVTGIVGVNCAEVTAAIEAQLGIVLHQETTSEYFAQAVEQSTIAVNHATSSEW